MKVTINDLFEKLDTKGFPYIENANAAHQLNFRYIQYISQTLFGKSDYVLNIFKELEPERSEDVRYRNKGYFGGKIQLSSYINHNSTSGTLIESNGYESFFGFKKIQQSQPKKTYSNNDLFGLLGTDGEIDMSKISELVQQYRPNIGNSTIGQNGVFKLDVNIELLLKRNQELGGEVLQLLYDCISIGDHDILHDLTFQYYRQKLRRKNMNIKELGKQIETRTLVVYFGIFQKIFSDFPEKRKQLIEKWIQYKDAVERLEGQYMDQKRNHLLSMYLFFLGRIINLNDKDIHPHIQDLNQSVFQIKHGSEEYNILHFSQTLSI